MTPELSDGVITLSQLSLDDVDAHFAGEDELLVRWLNGGPGTRAGVEEYIRQCMQQWDIDGPLRAFGIRVSAELVGTVDLRWGQPSLSAGQVNVAFGLYPAWRGRGLATRAVKLACRYAASAGASQAVIKVAPDNVASEAVARRSGFTALQDSDEFEMNWFILDL